MEIKTSNMHILYSSILILMASISLTSCSTLPKEEPSVNFDGKGVIIGKIQIQKRGMDKSMHPEMIQGLLITFVDWYPFNEITIKSDKAGFYFLEIDRTSMFFLKSIRFIYKQGFQPIDGKQNIVFDSSQNALRCACEVGKINNTGSIFLITNPHYSSTKNFNMNYDEISNHFSSLIRVRKSVKKTTNNWSNG